MADLTTIHIANRVVLINLRRRPDRLAAFEDRRRTAGWALPNPKVVPAVDGRECGVPDWYTAGPGAYGCMRSHLTVLEQAMSDKIETLMVMEDDATWDRTIWPRLSTFLENVPTDWDMLMLGGQHQTAPPLIHPGVVRCLATERTHAYVVRGPAMKRLYHLWLKATGHIDHAMGRSGWQRANNVYAPDRFLFGQAAGKSDINGKVNPAKIWTKAPADRPVYHLTAPAGVVRTLRDQGVIHTGHTRHPVTDLDRGLDAAVKGPPDYRKAGIQRWAESVLSEVEATPMAAVCWYPGLDAVELKLAVTPRPVVVIVADTVDTAIQKLPPNR